MKMMMRKKEKNQEKGPAEINIITNYKINPQNKHKIKLVS